MLCLSISCYCPVLILCVLSRSAPLTNLLFLAFRSVLYLLSLKCTSGISFFCVLKYLCTSDVWKVLNCSMVICIMCTGYSKDFHTHLLNVTSGFLQDVHTHCNIKVCFTRIIVYQYKSINYGWSGGGREEKVKFYHHCSQT